MKPLLPVLLWLWPCLALARTKEVSFLSFKDTVRNNQRPTVRSGKPDVLNSGFIDIMNNGQVNASARLLRLYVGEQGKWAIPLSVYSGVSSNNFQNQQAPGGQRSNEHLVAAFINPMSGLANFSLDGLYFFRPRVERITRSGFLTQGGIRILTGYKSGPITEPATGRPVNFLSSFASAGLYFQTGAWERTDNRNMGIFWLAGRYIFTQTGPKQLAQCIPSLQTNGFYHGWSLAWGVEINNLVNVKLIYYRYIKQPEFDPTASLYQFSFHYALR